MLQQNTECDHNNDNNSKMLRQQTLRSRVCDTSQLLMNSCGFLANPRKKSRFVLSWLIVSTVSWIYDNKIKYWLPRLVIGLCSLLFYMYDLSPLHCVINWKVFLRWCSIYSRSSTQCFPEICRPLMDQITWFNRTYDLFLFFNCCTVTLFLSSTVSKT